MEMMQTMQTQPAGLQNVGSVAGLLPAGADNEFLHALLTQQQLVEPGKAPAEDGHASVLAGWFLPGWPPTTTEEPTVEPSGQAITGYSFTSLGAGDAVSLQPGLDINGRSGLMSGAVTLAGAETKIAEAPIPSTELAQEGQLVPKNASETLPALSQAGMATMADTSRAPVTLGVALQDPRTPDKNQREPAARQLGILEKRVAEILRPVQALSVSNRAGEGDVAPSITALATGMTAAAGQTDSQLDGTAAVTTTLDAEGLAAVVSAKHQAGLHAGQPDLVAAGDVTAGRHSAPAAAPPATQSAAGQQPFGSTVTESQILDQVIGRITVDRNQDVSRMSIRLQPEELGRLEINLTVEQGRVKAQMVAQNQQVQEVLERHMPRLREALEQQGLNIDHIEVSIDPQAKGGKGFSQQHQQTGGHLRQHVTTPHGEPVAAGAESPPPMFASPGKVSLRI